MLKPQKETNNKIIPIVAIVVLFGVAGFVFAWNHRPHPGTPQSPYAYFYDLSSGKQFAALNDTPPIMGPSGEKGPNGDGTGVRAYVMSCGNCANKAQTFVAYLESISRAKSSIRLYADPLQPSDYIVASPSDTNTWVSEDSADGQKIIDEGTANPACAGKPVHECAPPAPAAK